MKPEHTVTLVRDRHGNVRALRHPRWLLRVVKGPDRRREKRISGRSALIGSSEAADLALTDATVSACHCRLELEESGLRVVDLGAKNGVYLGGHRVQQAWLANGSELVLGETVVRVSLLDEQEEQLLPARSSLGRLHGGSVRMRALYDSLLRAANVDTPVLLQGETGTGKELAAEAIVHEGPRRNSPFEVVDCGRLHLHLAESALFGHEEGAFTGATRAYAGALERAGDGTLFLDEVGELPLELQSRLLGALDRRTFQRLGGTAPLAFRARVISATHRRLEEEVNARRFRADLFYRLAGIQISLPPLRERAEDIPALVSHFLDELEGAPSLPPAVLNALCTRDYPGNVRELRNAVERAALGLGVEPRPPSSTVPDPDAPYHVQKERALEQFQRAYLERLLDRCGGNVSEAARRSGLDRMHLSTLLRRLGLTRS